MPPAASAAVPAERLRRQPFAGLRPLQIAVRDSEHFLPSVVKDGRLDRRHTCGVRIGLGCDIQPARLRFANGFQKVRHGAEAAALDVCDMEWRTRDRGGRHHFLHGGNTVGGLAESHVTEVNVGGCVVTRGGVKHFQDFQT